MHGHCFEIQVTFVRGYKYVTGQVCRAHLGMQNLNSTEFYTDNYECTCFALLSPSAMSAGLKMSDFRLTAGLGGG